ncbi:MAG: alpha/beta hydrolase [Bacteroidota bacterium]
MIPHPKIYLIPGLGADGRLFTGLREAGLEFEVLEFIPPHKGESLHDYAGRLAAPIDATQPFIIGGVSLGGILSVEVAFHKRPAQVLLISSVKNSREFPFYFKLNRYLRLHRLFSGKFFKRFAPRDPRRGMAPYKCEILDQMRRDADPWFVQWAVDAVIHWRRKEAPTDTLHIHGTRDLMFPGLLLGERHKIRKGSHVMVLNREPEIMEILRAELASPVQTA